MQNSLIFYDLFIANLFFIFAKQQMMYEYVDDLILTQKKCINLIAYLQKYYCLYNNLKRELYLKNNGKKQSNFSPLNHE